MLDAMQRVRVAIRRGDVSPSFVDEDRELAVAPSTTLRELLQILALADRYPHARNWTFAVNGQSLAWSDRVGDLAVALRETSDHDGVLWLDLLYVIAPESPAGERPSAPGSLAPPASPPHAPAALPSAGAPRSRGTMVEYKKGMKGLSDEEADEDEDEPRAEAADALPRKAKKYKRSSTERRATVRYYTRMNPDRMFPLLVILSAKEIEEVVKAKVKQAVSESFKVEEGSHVEIEPVLPGCDVYPPRHMLAVDDKESVTESFWVVPRVLGRVHGARVLIRQGERVLAEVKLDVKVAKQTLAVACGLMSLAAPYLTMGLKSLKLDYESQKADGFPLYQQAGNWVAENLRPEWLGLGFLGLALLLYLWMRPRRRDVFWDVNLK